MTTLHEAARAFLEAVDAWRAAPCDEERADRLEDMYDAEESMRAALAADPERVNEWQPIGTCPDSCRGEYTKYVLFYNGHHTGVGFCYPSEDGDGGTLYVDEGDSIIIPKPTHWMALPNPPMLAAAEKEKS